MSVKSVNRESVLKGKPSWHVYNKNDNITQDKIDLIYKYDGSTLADFVEYFGTEKKDEVINYIQAVYALFLKMKDQKSMRYLTTLLDDFLVGDSERLIYIFPDLHSLPLHSFSSILDQPNLDKYTLTTVTNIQGCIISCNEYPLNIKKERLLFLLSKINSNTDIWKKSGRSSTSLYISKAIIEMPDLSPTHESYLKEIYFILRDKRLVPVFLSHYGFQLIANYYNGSSLGIQAEYEILSILWQCSYYESQEIYSYFFYTQVLKNIITKIKNYTREKCLRIALYTLNNLIRYPETIEDYIEADLSKILKSILERTFNDPDIKQTCETIIEILTSNYHTLSSYDRYLKELQTKTLTWGPVHTSDFFKDNINMFEKTDFEILKLLKDILIESQDIITLSIACYDIGEFNRFYPPGRSICKTNGIKEIILKLLNHKSIEVVREALTACSKMTINSWNIFEMSK